MKIYRAARNWSLGCWSRSSIPYWQAPAFHYSKCKLWLWIVL